MLKIAISGTSGGLGKWLKQNINGLALYRDKLKSYTDTFYDTIIHCAFERFGVANDSKIYIDNSVLLAQDLLKLNAKRYIFISSVECNKSDQASPYALAKRRVENLFAKKNNYLNIRLPSLYGPGMIRNQIFNIATQKHPQLSLNQSSTFSLISYSDVKHFIEKKNILGTVSLLSDIVSLKDIADTFGSEPCWGSYVYVTKEGNVPRFKINENKALLKYKKFIATV